ncbi:MAG: transporter substrate-binding domain-containing protein, partial [Bacteroidaceae bacterium]|nr:transporter substrate-binding domain-containing protein [Bacteroidaceae bacterium]
VMVNPGGLNEQFAREHLPEVRLIIHPKNEEIPALVAEGKADIMITEIVEAPYYVQLDDRLAAPLIDRPFTEGMIGVLMRQGDEDLLERVNAILDRCRKDGTLQHLYEKYGFNANF